MQARLKTGLTCLVCVSIGLLTNPSAGSGPASAPSSDQALTSQTAFEDVLFGNGTRGPYPLSWSALVPATEAISINGGRVLFGLEYALDYTRGTITFQEPLVPGQVARVQYRYDPGRSRPNPNGARLPLDLTLWQGGRSSLQVVGTVPTSAGGGASAPVLGLSARSERSGGSFSSQFLVNPSAEGTKGGTWDRTSLRLGAATGIAGLRIAADLAQTGAEFAGVAPDKGSAGTRRLDLNVGYDASKKLTFQSKVERVDALETAKRGQERFAEQHRLAITPAAGSRLTLSRDVTGKTRADGRQERKSQESAQLEQRIGKARATARVSRAEGAAGEETASSLSLNVAPTKRLLLNSQVSRGTSERNGDRSTLGFGWNARLGKLFILDGAVSRSGSENLGTDDVRYLKLLMGFLTVEGRRKEREHVSGTDDLEELILLEAALMRGLRFGGSRGSRVAGLTGVETDLSEAFVEIRPDGAFRLRGGVQWAVTGDQAARATSVSGSLKASRLLDVNGSYKAREDGLGDTLISREYTVALKPARGLTLQGAYRENPEDKEGRVLDQLHTSLGLHSQLGSLGLTGTYTEIETGQASRGAEQMELKLTLKLARQTQFYSGYKERETRELSSLRDRAFSFGFSRTVGRSFFLLLEGEHILSEREGQGAAEESETRANARLGLHF